MLVLALLTIVASASTPPDPVDPPEPVGRGPVEFGVTGGLLLSDPFIRRQSIGVDLGLRANDLFAIEVSGSFSPDWGQGNWTARTYHMIFELNAIPDVRTVDGELAALGRVTPVRGTLGRNRGGDANAFEVYGVLGGGFVWSRPFDDSRWCSQSCPPRQQRRAPAAVFGLGATAGMSPGLALRLEVRSTTYFPVPVDPGPGGHPSIEAPRRQDFLMLRIGLVGYLGRAGDR